MCLIQNDLSVSSELKSYNSKMILCHYCGKTFISKKGFDFHIKVVHKKLTNFKCKICNKKFGKDSDLKTTYKYNS